nr:hypothetical protein [Planctomycetota bacterium]
VVVDDGQRCTFSPERRRFLPHIPRLPLLGKGRVRPVMRFVWNGWNSEHVARHRISQALAEQVAQVAELEKKEGVRFAGVGTVNGIRYRIVLMAGMVTDEVYVVTCYHLRRGSGSGKLRDT